MTLVGAKLNETHVLKTNINLSFGILYKAKQNIIVTTSRVLI